MAQDLFDLSKNFDVPIPLKCRRDIPYFCCSGHPANLLNREVRVREKRLMTLCSTCTVPTTFFNADNSEFLLHYASVVSLSIVNRLDYLMEAHSVLCHVEPEYLYKI
jgi:hypothetical protein